MSTDRTTSLDLEDARVTAVIPYCEEFTPRSMLEEAIETVENQANVDAEALVVEDEDQRGPAWARNVGLERADTRLVAFLDADDLWKEDKLERQIRRMEATGAGLCVEGEPGRSAEAFVRGLLVGDTSGLTSTILVDTERVDARFDENLERREDHLYMIEAAATADVCFVEDLYDERLLEDGLSANVEKSPAQAEAFFQRILDVLPEAQQLRNEYYQEAYVDVGRYRHYQGDYLNALCYFARSLRHGPNINAIGAIGLTVLAVVYREPSRWSRQ